jgi:hypothetical protein
MVASLKRGASVQLFRFSPPALPNIPRSTLRPGYVGPLGDVPTRGRDDKSPGVSNPTGSPDGPPCSQCWRPTAPQLVLPDSLVRGLGNRALIPSLVGVLLLVLLIANPGRISKEQSRLRVVGLALIALITVVNVVSLIELIHALLYGSRAGGRSLVYASVSYLVRPTSSCPECGSGSSTAAGQPPDSNPSTADRTSYSPRCPRRVPPPAGYRTFLTISIPLHVLCTSFTNATAFSPTDTMPLTA